MYQLIIKSTLIISLITGIFADKYPKDITGKWMVDNVEAGDAINKIPEDRREMVLIMAKEIMRTAVFEFKADHTCVLTANIPNAPKGGTWDYDPKTGVIKISGKDQNGKPGTMVMNAVEKGSKVFITLQKSPVVLSMHKK